MTPFSHHFEEVTAANKTTIITYGYCDDGTLTESSLSFNFHPDPTIDESRYCSNSSAMNICEIDSPKNDKDEKEEDDRAFELPRMSTDELHLKVCKQLEEVSNSLKKSAQRYEATIEKLNETI